MINNEFYKDLGEHWFTADGDAIALLRLENECKGPWLLEQLGDDPKRVLDVGCGGGFLTLQLAAHGHHCTGLDVDARVFAAARARSGDLGVDWVEGRAQDLPFADATFDVVCVMDVLEHIDDPELAIIEATRVLRPGGRLFFHTFNRTWESWVLAAKGMQWFVPDPAEGPIHEWSLFIKPIEIHTWLRALAYKDIAFTGIKPKLKSVMKLLLTRRVPVDFEFELGGGLRVGYLGQAKKSL